MIRLTLLRGIGLVDASGRSIDTALSQAKRLAVLAYLCLQGRELGCQRDALLALFWPEMTPRRARQALNTTTHFLRQQLGHDCIVSRGPNSLGIVPDALWCDAVAFLENVENDPATALQLYSGDLLPGFYIGAGHEFDRWLDEERHHLRGLAADAARRMAQRAAAEGDTAEVTRLARRLVDLADNDEVLVRQAITLMGQAGERSWALDAYARFASRLSDEYTGARPSPETIAIVERIRAQEMAPEPTDPLPANPPSRVTTGAFLAAPEVARQESGALVMVDSGGARHGAAHPWSWLAAERLHRWTIALVSGATLATALLLAAKARTPNEARLAAAALPRVEIAGFTALDDNPASTRVAAALSQDVAGRLTKGTSIEVMERRDDLGHTESPRRDFAADLVATGSVAHSGARLVISLDLVDGRAGTTVRTARSESSAGKLATADTLASRIAQIVQETLRRQVRLRRTQESLHDERLYRFVQDAEEDCARADTLREQDQPQAAIRALASADTTLMTVERAVPSNADVRTTRSKLLVTLALSYLVPPTADATKMRLSLTEALGDADTAMALDTTSADAAEEFANAGWLFVSAVPLPADSDARVSARIERALHRAIAIDPHRPGAWTPLSRLLFGRGDYAGAYDAAHHAYDTDAFDEFGREVLVRLSASAYELGDDSASAHWCTEMARKYPHESGPAFCELGIVARAARPTQQSIQEAWQLASEAADGRGADPLIAPRVQMLVAQTIARANLRDSAEHVLARAHASAGTDAEAWPFEAEARAVLGEQPIADSLIRGFVALAPAHRVGLLRSRRFRPVRAG